MKTETVLIGLGALAAAGIAIYMVKRKQDQQAIVTATEAQQQQAVVNAQAQAQAQTNAVKTKNAAVLLRYPAGTLVRISGQDSVYKISDLGERQWITNRKVFDAMHLNMADVKSITSTEMNRIPIGPAISSVPAPINGVIHLLSL